MKMLTFAGRNTQEILRDPINLGFGLGFPLALIFLLTAIQANIPVEMFRLEHLTPGIGVFGLSFITLFSATIIARDRSSALLQRLYTTPLRSADFILGYTLPLIPLAVGQCAICYLAAIILGLPANVNVLYAIVSVIPISALYIALGLLCGSIFTDKQAGSVCGALLTNLSAWLSGIWFDLDLMGNTFKKIANGLPFVHAVELQRAILVGNISDMTPHIWWVLGYAAILLTTAIFLFLRQMKRQ